MSQARKTSKRRATDERRRAQSRGATRRSWLLIGGVLLILAGVVIGRTTRGPVDAPFERPEESAANAAAAPSSRSDSGRAAPIAADLPVAPRRGEALVALVIDDLGRSLGEVDQLLGLGVELSYAVLPFETRTAEVAQRLAEHGAEVLVHLPMEADGAANPGPGALLRSMAADELARRTRDALAAVPGAVGANNHMGSALSADDEALKPVLGVLEERDLFFLDSRTSADSVGFREARRMGIPAAQRQVFLDREIDVGEIRTQFLRLLVLAADSGAAIAIGHPYPETLQVLREEIPGALEAGFRFVPVSFLLERSGVEGM